MESYTLRTLQALQSALVAAPKSRRKTRSGVLGSENSELIFIGGKPISAVFPITWDSVNGIYTVDSSRFLHGSVFSMLASEPVLDESVFDPSIHSVSIEGQTSIPDVSGVLQSIADCITDYVERLNPWIKWNQVNFNTYISWMIKFVANIIGRKPAKFISTANAVRMLLLTFAVFCAETQDGNVILIPKLTKDDPKLTYVGIAPEENPFYLGSSVGTLLAPRRFNVEIDFHGDIEPSFYHNGKPFIPLFDNTVDVFKYDHCIIDTDISHWVGEYGYAGVLSYEVPQSGLQMKLIPERYPDRDYGLRLLSLGPGVLRRNSLDVIDTRIDHFEYPSLLRFRWCFIDSNTNEVYVLTNNRVDFYDVDIISYTWGFTLNRADLNLRYEDVKYTDPHLQLQGRIMYAYGQSYLWSGNLTSVTPIKDCFNFTQLWYDILFDVAIPLDDENIVAEISKNTRLEDIDPIVYRELAKNITLSSLESCQKRLIATESYITAKIELGADAVADDIDLVTDVTLISESVLPIVDFYNDVPQNADETIESAIVKIDNFERSYKPFLKDWENKLELFRDESDNLQVLVETYTGPQNLYLSELRLLYDQAKVLEAEADVLEARLGSKVNLIRSEAEGIFAKVIANTYTDLVDETLAGLLNDTSINSADVITILDNLKNKTVEAALANLGQISEGLDSIKIDKENVKRMLEESLSDANGVAQTLLGRAREHLNQSVNGVISLGSVALTKFTSGIENLRNLKNGIQSIFVDDNVGSFGMQKLDSFYPVSLETTLNKGIGAAVEAAGSTLSIISGVIKSLAAKGWNAVNKVIATAGGSVQSFRAKSYGLNTLDVIACSKTLPYSQFQRDYPLLAQALDLETNEGFTIVIQYGKNYHFFQKVGDVVSLGINPRFLEFDPDVVKDDFQFAKLMANSMIDSAGQLKETIDTFQTYFNQYLWDQSNLIFTIPNYEDLIEIAIRNVKYQEKTHHQIKTASLIALGVGIALSFFTFGLGAAVAATALTTMGITDAASVFSAPQNLEDKLRYLEMNDEAANSIKSADLVNMWQSYLPSKVIDVINYYFDIGSADGWLHDGTGKVFPQIQNNGESLGFIPVIRFSGQPRYKYSLITSEQENLIQLSAITAVVVSFAAIAGLAFVKGRQFRAKRKLRQLELRQKTFTQPSPFLSDGTVNPNYAEELRLSNKEWNRIMRKKEKLSRIFNTKADGSSKSMSAVAALTAILRPDANTPFFNEFEHINDEIIDIQTKQGSLQTKIVGIQNRIG